MLHTHSLSIASLETAYPPAEGGVGTWATFGQTCLSRAKPQPLQVQFDELVDTADMLGTVDVLSSHLVFTTVLLSPTLFIEKDVEGTCPSASIQQWSSGLGCAL